MTEIWKPVVGYEGRYEVSNFGRIRSFITWVRGRRETPWFVFGWENTHGYIRVGLRDAAGKNRYHYMHRIVLRAFRGEPPENAPQSAHLDGNPGNNNIDNLIWASVSENMLHKRLHGTATVGEKSNLAKLTEKQVKEIRSLRGTGLQYKDVANRYGIGKVTVWAIWARKSWRHI